jgi:hypothetical protein
MIEDTSPGPDPVDDAVDPTDINGPEFVEVDRPVQDNDDLDDEAPELDEDEDDLS